MYTNIYIYVCNNFLKGRKLHFHAHIGALFCFCKRRMYTHTCKKILLNNLINLATNSMQQMSWNINNNSDKQIIKHPYQQFQQQHSDYPGGSRRVGVFFFLHAYFYQPLYKICISRFWKRWWYFSISLAFCNLNLWWFTSFWIFRGI